MSTTFYDRVKVLVASAPGTGAIAIGAASPGYRNFDGANVPDQATVSYAIEDGANWEIGHGTFQKGAVPSHRFWRVHVTHVTGTGDNYCSIGELQFRATPGGASQTGGTVVAGAGANSPGAVFDGDPTSRWYASYPISDPTNGANAWVGMDYGSSPVSVSEVALEPDTGHESETPTAFNLDWSDDGVTWNTQQTFTRDPAKAAWVTNEVDLFEVTQGRVGTLARTTIIASSNAGAAIAASATAVVYLTLLAADIATFGSGGSGGGGSKAVPSARYWRLSNLGSTAGGSASVAEFSMLDGGGAVIAPTAVSGAPSANSSTPAQAANGNPADFYDVSALIGNYIALDFGTAITPVSVKITNRSDGYAQYNPIGCDLQCSTDGVTYTQVQSLQCPVPTTVGGSFTAAVKAI